MSDLVSVLLHSFLLLVKTGNFLFEINQSLHEQISRDRGGYAGRGGYYRQSYRDRYPPRGNAAITTTISIAITITITITIAIFNTNLCSDQRDGRERDIVVGIAALAVVVNGMETVDVTTVMA